ISRAAGSGRARAGAPRLARSATPTARAAPPASGVRFSPPPADASTGPRAPPIGCNNSRGQSTPVSAVFHLICGAPMAWMERFEGSERPSSCGTGLAPATRNPVGFSWLRRAFMDQSAGLEELIAEFRQMLPAQCETAQAIDRQEPFERIA